MVVLGRDKVYGCINLSTKVLEQIPGDMLRDPKLVYAGAEARAMELYPQASMAEVRAI